MYQKKKDGGYEQWPKLSINQKALLGALPDDAPRAF